MFSIDKKLSNYIELKRVKHFMGFAFLCVLSSQSVQAASPGGVAASLELWLAADVGVTEVSNVVSDWGDQSVNARTHSQATSGNKPSYQEDALNYNPSIIFDGDDKLSGTAADGPEGVVIAVFDKQKDGSQTYADVVTSGSSTLRLEQWNSLGLYGYSRASVGDYSANLSSNYETPTLIIYRKTASGSTYEVDEWSALNAYRTGTINLDQSTDRNVPYSGMIGRQSEAEFSEVLSYSQDLSVQELAQIKSYLAIKYGFTLVESGNVPDYIASDGSTKIWDTNASNASTYNNDIFGIGRDDLSSLDQRISKSANTGATLVVSLDADFTSSNKDASRTTLHSNNNQFLVLADNAGSLSLSNNEMDLLSNYNARISREWMVNSTNFSQSVNAKFSGFESDSNSNTTYYLLEDSDGDFSSGAIELGTLDANGEIAAVNFLDGRYYTLASITVAPGGVAGDLKLWLKAGAGNNTISAGEFDTWANQAPSGVDDAGQDGTNKAAFASGNALLNYNASGSFTGPSEAIRYRVSNLQITGQSSIFYIGTNPEQANSGSVYKPIMAPVDFSYNGNVDNAGYIFGLKNGASDFMMGAPESGGLSEFSVSSTVGTRLFSLLTDNTTPDSVFSVDAGVSNTNSAYTAFSGDFSTGYYLGGDTHNADRYINSDIGEVIIYNERLSGTQVQKVQSYLALKYGISLDQTIASDYLGSDGTTIWDKNSSDASIYNNDIFGIGRDDISSLDQRVSKSVNTGSPLILSLNADFTSANSDASRTTAHSNNNQFLILADNAGSLTLSNTELNLSDYNARLAREWKVDATNFSQAVNVKFSGFESDSYTTYFLLEDTDGDFSSGTNELGALDTNGELLSVNLLDGYYYTLASITQTPGGVESSLQLWLKADAGVTEASNAVSDWSDQSVNVRNHSQADSNLQPEYIENGLNNNPSIQFDGGDLLSGPFANGPEGYVIAVFDNEVAGAGADGADYLLISDVYSIRLEQWPDTGVYGYTLDAVNDYAATLSSSFATPTLVVFRKTAAGTLYEISEWSAANTHRTGTINVEQSTSRNVPYSGHLGLTVQAQFSEVLTYGQDLTLLELSQVTSYLAIKYGFSLVDGGTPQNYLASDGTTKIWDKNANSASIYSNDIFGIGRDDFSSLGQIKSTSVNDDAVVLMEAIGEGSNLSNSFSDLENKEFLTLANNDGTASWTTTDAPANYQILARKWQFQEVGETGDISLSFDVDDTDFDVPSASLYSTYYAVYDSDNDGVLSDETPILLSNSSGSTWQTSAISPEHERTLTLATLVTYIPTNIDLSGANEVTINENSGISFSVGTLSSTDLSAPSSHSYSLVSGAGDDDNALFSVGGANNDEITLLFDPDFENPQDSNTDNVYNIRVQTDNGNGGVYTEALTVRIANTDDVAPVISLTGADPQQLTVGSAYTELGATASDDVDGDLTSSILVDSTAVDLNVVSSYSVSYNVSDAAGNNAVEVTRTVNVIAGAASVVASTITSVESSLVANGSSTSLVTVQLKDSAGNLVASGGETVVIATSLGSVSATTDNLDGSYTATLTSSATVGTATVSYSLNSSPGSQTTDVSFIPDPQLFITTWKTDNPGGTSDTSLTIPTTGSGYAYQVDWNNDGDFLDADEGTINTGSVTHDFAVAGTYTIAIKGSFPRIYFNNSGDKLKITSLDQWGTGLWSSMQEAFNGAENLLVPASDAPNLTAVSNMFSMFKNALIANPDVSNWNVSNVKSMSGMFKQTTMATPDVLTWDVSNVTDMAGMFNGALAATPNTSNWDTSSVTSMKNMFKGALLASPNTSSWNTSVVDSMKGMFENATLANPDTQSWDISAVTNMVSMFSGVTLPTAAYDLMLKGFNRQVLSNSVTFHGGNSKYCTSEASRDEIVASYTWTISDGGKACEDVPGGVNADLVYWVKADAGVSLSSSEVTQWDDQSYNAAITTEASKIASAGVTLDSTVVSNCNPAVIFDGSANERLVGAVPQNTWDGPMTIFSISRWQGGSTAATNGVWSSAEKGLALHDNPAYYALDGSGASESNSANTDIAETNAASFNLIVGSYASGSSTDLTSLYANGKLEEYKTGGGVPVSTNGVFEVGGRTDGGFPNRVWNGEISEVIIYNSVLSTLDRRKVEGYLAVKYGISLDQSSPTDYIASDGTSKVWDTTPVDSFLYNNDIFGIGRDDDAGLDQRISTSINAGTILTIALDDDFSSANNGVARTTLHANDKQFLVYANNGAALSSQTTELDTAIYEARVAREWKLDSSSNFGQSVFLNFSGMASVGTRVYYLLSDADGDFSSGATVLSALNSNGTTSAITLSDGDYYTIAFNGVAPGGTDSNLAFWLKADAGTSCGIDGCVMTQWDGQQLASNVATVGGGSVNYIEDAFNSHPGISVDDLGFLEFSRPISNDISAYVVFKTTETAGSDWWYNSPAIIGGEMTNVVDDYGLTLDAGIAGVTVRNDLHDFQGGTLLNDGQSHLLLNTRQVGTGAVTQFSDGKADGTGTTNGVSVTAPPNLRLGRQPTGSGQFEGTYAEVLMYDSIHSGIEAQQVQSYLALKYGITLDQTVTQDYLASDSSTKIWNKDASNASQYNHDIFGIGRDDASGLGQLKSKSVNADAIVQLEALGEGSNASAVFDDIDNYEFLTLANNDASFSWTATGSPTDYNILSRTWLFQETGDTGDIKISFDVDDPQFNVPAPILGTVYYVIVDADNDGDLSDETPIALTNSSGSIWEASSIQPANGQKMALATFSNNTPSDIQLDGSNSDTVAENTSSGTTVGTLSTTDIDVTDSHSYSLVSGTGDEDNARFTIGGSSSNELKLAFVPDFEIPTDSDTDNTYNIRVQTDDGHVGYYAEALTVVVSNLDDTQPTITLIGANPQLIEAGTAYSELGATASDNVDGDITANINAVSTAVTTSVAGDYTVTYNVSDAAGNNAVEVTRTVTIYAGAASTTTSTITSATSDIIANGVSTSLITVQLKDALGNNLTASAGTVVMSSSLGAISAVTDAGDGSFTATLTSISTLGTATVSYTLDSSAGADDVDIEFTVDAASAVTSTITATPSSIVADGFATSTITVQLLDANGLSLSDNTDTVVISTSLGSVGAVTNNHDGSHSAILTSPTSVGTAAISYTLNGSAGSNTTSVEFTTNLDPFITTWKTDNAGTSNSTSITIPAAGGGHSYQVDWNNDGDFLDSDEATLYTAAVTHDFGTTGSYTIGIKGSFPRISIAGVGDRLKLLSIDQWGTGVWSNMANAFQGAENLVINATDVPNLSSVTSMASMFRECTLANPDTSQWDTSSVTTMYAMFSSASAANPDTSNWDTSLVSNMGFLFKGTDIANPDTSNWDTSSVTNMQAMFSSALIANPDTSNWVTSSVTDMRNMFSLAASADPDTSGWNTSEVLDMRAMFNLAVSANPDLDSWDIAKVTNMESMFAGVTLPTVDYDSILKHFSQQLLNSNLSFSGGNSQYCTAEADRQGIIDSFTWVISDAGLGCATTPGGVNDSLAIWLKADQGTDCNTDGCGVASWSDQSTNGMNGTAYNSPIYLESTNNFNPSINFAGNLSQYIDLPDGLADFTDGLSAYVVANLKGLRHYERFFDFGNGDISNNILFGRYAQSSNGVFEVFNNADPQDKVIANYLVNNQQSLYSVVQAGGVSGSSNIPSLYRDGESFSDTGTAYIPQNVLRQNNYIGRSNWSGDGYLEGEISEFVLFSRNSSENERQRIQSYLAIKYGIELDQSSPTSYFASDGSTTIWDASASDSSVYNNDIFGLGRDDDSALDQKVSKSANPGALLTAALDSDFTISNINAARTTLHATDQQYLVFADNGAAHVFKLGRNRQRLYLSYCS